MLPDEDGSFEQNPPTLLEFIRRDLRWCQGNMQYWHFLRMPGPAAGQPLSAAARDPDVPRLAGLDRLAAARHGRGSRLHPRPRTSCARTPALPLLSLVLVMWFAPNIATVIDVLARADAAARLRRRRAFRRELAIQTIFSSSCWPRSVVSATPCSWRACCSAARSAGARRRATITRCRWSLAVAQLWPQTVIGWAVLVLLAATMPSALAVSRLLHCRRTAARRSRSRSSPRLAGVRPRSMARPGFATCRRRQHRRRELAALELPAIERRDRAG